MWWIGIAIQPFVVVFFTILMGLQTFGLELPLFGIIAFKFLPYIYLLCSISYIFDAGSIAKYDGCDWNPGRISYFIFGFLFGIIVSPIYLYKRRKCVQFSKYSYT